MRAPHKSNLRSPLVAKLRALRVKKKLRYPYYVRKLRVPHMKNLRASHMTDLRAPHYLRCGEHESPS